ncbi:MAG: 30S ribosomal protein S3 [Anaplasmataceae bacterium]|nr:30S ribosomal protein S3 [Anaplasmataceae bacterium]
MGHKIHPHALRIGVSKKWPVRWFLRGDYPKLLEQDEKIRKIINKKIGQAGIAGVEIERTHNKITVTVKVARPGFVIGRGGKGIEELSKTIEKEINTNDIKKQGKSLLSINVEELKRTEASASYVAQQIAWDIERRLPFRRLLKKYLEQLMQNKDVKGAKIMVAGRLNGAEIARTEWLKLGQLPLQTLRANVEYGQATANTTYGTVGVKVWVNKGEVFEE